MVAKGALLEERSLRIRPKSSSSVDELRDWRVGGSMSDSTGALYRVSWIMGATGVFLSRPARWLMWEADELLDSAARLNIDLDCLCSAVSIGTRDDVSLGYCM